MNVAILNEKKNLLNDLGMDIIKEMVGEFSVEEIINTFQNFFYQRMIIDLTAIKNYEQISTIQSLASSLNMSKIIIILDGTGKTNNKTYISKLISLGIYNFTDNLKGIQYLYNYPNSYNDVAMYHEAEDNFVSYENNDIVSNTNNNNDNIINSNEDVDIKDNNVERKNIFFDNYVTEEKNRDAFLNNNKKCRVIGIKNLTRESGATSLTYMIVKSLSRSYKAVGIEVNKNDFVYFKDKSLVSTSSDNLELIIKKYENYDAIIVDINDDLACESLCNDVLYLIEPSIIKLQKLVSLNRNSLNGYKNKKIILNQSLLDSGAVNAFEYESGLKIFYNLKPLNEREDKFDELDKMLIKLGFNKLR